LVELIGARHLLIKSKNRSYKGSVKNSACPTGGLYTYAEIKFGASVVDAAILPPASGSLSRQGNRR